MVVETTHFNGQASYQGSSEGLHLVERFTRVDADTLEYEYTVEDPVTYARPWTASIAMKPVDGDLYEFACHEGNYGMVGILGGARADDKAAEAAATPSRVGRPSWSRAITTDWTRVEHYDVSAFIGEGEMGPVPSKRRYTMWSTLPWTRSLVTLAVAAVSLGTLATIPAAQQGQVVTTPSGQQLRVEPVATNLDTIWDMVWAPDGEMWVTERRGRVSRIDVSSGRVTPVGDIEGLRAGRERAHGDGLSSRFSGRTVDLSRSLVRVGRRHPQSARSCAV